MDDQKNIKPDFSKAGEDSILYKKEEPKTEREKLKELHGKDKIWYLVHYYGLQTSRVSHTLRNSAYASGNSCSI